MVIIDYENSAFRMHYLVLEYSQVSPSISHREPDRRKVLHGLELTGILDYFSQVL
jgi:hypothetical protein